MICKIKLIKLTLWPGNLKGFEGIRAETAKGEKNDNQTSLLSLDGYASAQDFSFYQVVLSNISFIPNTN